MAPHVAQNVLSQLHNLNAVYTVGFAEIVTDYLACLQRARELQVLDVSKSFNATSMLTVG